MNINEVHLTFLNNVTKEPAKNVNYTSTTFEPFGIFMRFSLLRSGEWTLSFYVHVCLVIYIEVSLKVLLQWIVMQKSSFRRRSTLFMTFDVSAENRNKIDHISISRTNTFERNFA